MLRFLRRAYVEESGIAMALAVMVMVIVGVMGAGLLVFVSNDLESVVEVNQGQSAFDIADAGSQAAKQQILGDKTPGHYDIEGGSPSCDSSEESPDRIGKNWSPQDEDPGGADEDLAGEERSFAGGNFDVTVQWLNQDPSADASCIAPETTSSPEDGVEYFRVVSTGTSGDAIRRVEAIYETYNLDVPRAYYTPGPLTVSGTACVDSVSLFSLSDITFNGSGGCTEGTHMRNDDLYYGNWDRPPFNTTPRSTASAGAGTPTTVTGSSRLGTRDFDSTSDPKMIRKVSPDASQDSSEISFPFDITEQPDANRLCDEAKRQDNYVRITSSGNYSLSNWPDNSSSNTVVCREFNSSNSSNKLIWDVTGSTNLAAPYEGCKGPAQEGTLVIKNGNFSTRSNRALFRGVVIVRGPEGSEGSDLGSSSDTGNTCLDGFINATSEVKIAGTVRPSTSNVENDRPGFFGARIWSWRELYE